MSDLKHKGESKKVQGERAATGNRGRALGSEYAMAVGNLKEQAENMKGSQKGFLGVPTQQLNPKDYCHKFDKKNK